MYLFVRKFPAVNASEGTVWLIAGGPGESGATFYPFIATLKRAFPNFDFLVPDHRGTGYSTRLCPVEEAIGSLGGGALVGNEVETCWHALRSQPTYTRAFSISNAARDLGYLISQVNRRGATYIYGVSYGTQLILRTLQIRRLQISGIILDSVTPPEKSFEWDLTHRDEILNSTGIAFLNRCQLFESCRKPINGSLLNAYSELVQDLPPQLRDQIPGGDLRVFFGGLLDSPRLRALIPQLIAELKRGQTGALRASKLALDHEMAALEQFPQSSISLPLLTLIGASENLSSSAPTSARPPTGDRSTWLFQTPIPTLLIQPQVPLYHRDEYFGAIPESLPPTLVIQGTLDPKTPFAGATDQVQRLSQSGSVRLVAATDSTHFVLMSAPECVIAAILRFRSGNAFESPAACNESPLSRTH